MKRAFVVTIAVLLAVLLAAPAWALDFGDISLKGHFRTRGWWVYNAADLNEDTTPNNKTWIDMRFRIEPTWKVNDAVKIQQRWTWGNSTYGESPKVEAFNLQRCWATLSGPFGIPGSLVFGRMPASWGLGITANDSTVDRLKLVLKFGDLTVVPHYTKRSEGDTTVNDDEDQYTVVVIYKQAAYNGGVVLSYVKGYSGSANPEAAWFMLLPYVKASVGPVNVGAELGYKGGQAYTDVDYSGIKMAVNVSGKLEPVSLFGEIGYASGDDPDTADEIESFNFHADYDVDLIMFEEVEGTVANSWYFRAKATYPASDKLSVSGGFIYAGALETPTDVSSDRGFELDFWSSYKLMPNVALKGLLGFFFPGGYYDDSPGYGNDMAYKVGYELKVSF